MKDLLNLLKRLKLSDFFSDDDLHLITCYVYFYNGHWVVMNKYEAIVLKQPHDYWQFSENRKMFVEDFKRLIDFNLSSIIFFNDTFYSNELHSCILNTFKMDDIIDEKVITFLNGALNKNTWQWFPDLSLEHNRIQKIGFAKIFSDNEIYKVENPLMGCETILYFSNKKNPIYYFFCSSMSGLE
jgi:hypothetical protein